MRKVYYSLMQTRAILLILISLQFLVTGSLGAQQQPASMKSASLESHEQMTIAAQPWMNAVNYREKFPKKSPYAAGILTIHVEFRNDSDDSVKINLEKIRLNLLIADDNRQELEPLTPADAADVILNPVPRDPTKKRFPIPVGKQKVGRDKHWTELEASLRDAGVHASVVAPHSTVQGLLYFNLQSQFDLLSTAHLYIPDLVAIEKNRGLLYFDIDLSHTAGN